MNVRSKLGKPPLAGAAIALGLTFYAIATRHRDAAVPGAPAAVGSARGRHASEPSDIPSIGWLDILKRVWAKLSEDNVSMMAAGVAFYAMLSLFPGLTALISVYGLVADPGDVQRFLQSQQLLPAEARTLVIQQLASLSHGGASKLGLGLVISLAFALWTTNYGTSTLLTALNVAYDEEERRSYLMVMATSLALTAALVLFGFLALLLIAVLPAVIDVFPVPDSWRNAIALVRWPILAVLVMAALAIVYRYGPSRERARWRWVSWGAVAATIAWIAMSYGFSFYVTRFSSYDRTYGSLGAVVVLLMWLYLTGYVILLGAELDAEMEHQTARDTTTGRPRPMGARGARKADTVAAANSS